MCSFHCFGFWLISCANIVVTLFALFKLKTKKNSKEEEVKEASIIELDENDDDHDDDEEAKVVKLFFATFNDVCYYITAKVRVKREYIYFYELTFNQN